MPIKEINSKSVLFERNGYLFCRDGQVYEKVEKNDIEDLYVISGIDNFYRELSMSESKKQFEVFVSRL